MKFNELLDENPGISEYLALFKDSKDYLLSTDGVSADIKLKINGLNLKLSSEDLYIISNGQRIKKAGFTYIKHCGIIYKDYGEISIDVFHPMYSFIEDAQGWNALPLRFKINNKLFEVDSSSPLFVLLNEPIYRDSDFQYDFQNFATIKVTNTNPTEIKTDIIKALFYLNSHYLQPTGFAAKIYQMDLSELDPLDIYNSDFEDIFKKVNRVRTRKRDDFISLEPLILYNHSKGLKGDDKYLCLYRILEFFMQRARLQKMKEMRFDEKIPDSILLKTFDQKNEEAQLENLLNEAITINKKKKISGYAFHKNLIKEDNFKFIGPALYKFRNSIVHAKESQISDTKIPDPFQPEDRILPWAYIMDEFIQSCIRKYNTI